MIKPRIPVRLSAGMGAKSGTMLEINLIHILTIHLSLKIDPGSEWSYRPSVTLTCTCHWQFWKCSFSIFIRVTSVSAIDIDQTGLHVFREYPGLWYCQLIAPPIVNTLPVRHIEHSGILICNANLQFHNNSDPRIHWDRPLPIFCCNLIGSQYKYLVTRQDEWNNPGFLLVCINDEWLLTLYESITWGLLIRARISAVWLGENTFEFVRWNLKFAECQFWDLSWWLFRKHLRNMECCSNFRGF